MQTVSNARELEQEFQSILVAFADGKETEENWGGRDKALQRLVGFFNKPKVPIISSFLWFCY